MLSLILSIMLVGIIFPSVIAAYAHIYDKRVQEWVNQRDNVKIQFTYEPEKPLVYTFTELNFSIQNLHTGEHLKDLIANITITNQQQKTFKFNNMSAPEGDFSIKSRFLDTGTYQVIIRIASINNAIALASFKVIIPSQPVGIINMNYLTPLLLPAGLVGIVSTILVVSLVIIVNRSDNK
jgi:hypothetical protein